MENQRVPLVIYGPDGERKVVGEAEIGDGEVLSHVTDHEVWEQLTGSLTYHLSIEEDITSPKGHQMDFTTFIRRPFKVEAIEVTDENFDQIAELTGTVTENNDGVKCIDTDRKIVQNVFRIYVGFWVTKMGENLRGYSAKTFNEMFVKESETELS